MLAGFRPAPLPRQCQSGPKAGPIYEFAHTVEGGRQRRTPVRRIARSEAALRLQHLTTAIHPGLQVDVVRAHHFTGGLVFPVGRLRERIVRTPVSAPGFGNFSLWNRHDLDFPDA
jgi:hypothetical protein